MFKIISALNLNIYHIFCYFYTFNKKWASQEDENTNKGTNICNSIRYVPVWKQYLYCPFEYSRIDFHLSHAVCYISPLTA